MDILEICHLGSRERKGDVCSAPDLFHSFSYGGAFRSIYVCPSSLPFWCERGWRFSLESGRGTGRMCVFLAERDHLTHEKNESLNSVIVFFCAFCGHSYPTQPRNETRRGKPQLLRPRRGSRRHRPSQTRPMDLPDAPGSRRRQAG
jgi:hypothetical protein